MSTVSQSTFARDLGLVGWQIRYEQRSYWRNRGRGVFTFVFPLMFLVIFASLDKGQHISQRGGIPYNDFLVPGILAYSVITTTFVNLAMGTAILRDNGILKRMQGTPLPRWAYVTARIGSTCLVTLLISATVIVGGVFIWGLHFRAGALPGLVVTMVLGTAAFTALGIAITRFIPNAETGPVVVNLLILPLTFISNIWFPTDSLPSALKTIAGLFPIRALANGLQYVFDPRNHAAGLDGPALRVLAIWTVIGVVMMVKFLRQPQGEVA